jgi:hypothetical protein
MKTKNLLTLFSLFLFLAGCASFQASGDVAAGRQALLREQRNRPGLFLHGCPEGSQLCLHHRIVTEARCLELCWTVGVSYRQISASPTDFGAGALSQSRRRYRQALSGLDLGSGG